SGCRCGQREGAMAEEWVPDHKCGRLVRSIVRWQLVVDRKRQTMQVMCSPCGERFDLPTADRAFRLWALGYEAAKRDITLRVMSTPTPDSQDWNLEAPHDPA